MPERRRAHFSRVARGAPADERGRDHRRAAGEHHERQKPSRQVEAFHGRRGEDLLAVLAAEAEQDLVAPEPLRDERQHLLLERDRRAALQVVARVDREPAAALAGERLLDLLGGHTPPRRRSTERQPIPRATEARGRRRALRSPRRAPSRRSPPLARRLLRVPLRRRRRHRHHRAEHHHRAADPQPRRRAGSRRPGTSRARSAGRSAPSTR